PTERRRRAGAAAGEAAIHRRSARRLQVKRVPPAAVLIGTRRLEELLGEPLGELRLHLRRELGRCRRITRAVIAGVAVHELVHLIVATVGFASRRVARELVEALLAGATQGLLPRHLPSLVHARYIVGAAVGFG